MWLLSTLLLAAGGAEPEVIDPGDGKRLRLDRAPDPTGELLLAFGCSSVLRSAVAQDLTSSCAVEGAVRWRPSDDGGVTLNLGRFSPSGPCAAVAVVLEGTAWKGRLDEQGMLEELEVLRPPNAGDDPDGKGREMFGLLALSLQRLFVPVPEARLGEGAVWQWQGSRWTGAREDRDVRVVWERDDPAGSGVDVAGKSLPLHWEGELVLERDRLLPRGKWTIETSSTIPLTASPRGPTGLYVAQCEGQLAAMTRRPRPPKPPALPALPERDPPPTPRELEQRLRAEGRTLLPVPLREIPAGQPLTLDDLLWVALPDDYVPSATIVGLDAILGRIPMHRLLSTELIRPERLDPDVAARPLGPDDEPTISPTAYEPERRGGDTVLVMVSATNLPVGKPITEQDLYATKIEPRYLSRDWTVLMPEDVIGRIPCEPILHNEILRAERLVDPATRACTVSGASQR